MLYDILELREMNEVFTGVFLAYKLDFDSHDNPIWVVREISGHTSLEFSSAQIAALRAAKYVRVYQDRIIYRIATLEHNQDICILTEAEYGVFQRLFGVPKKTKADCNVADSLSDLFI